MGRLTRRAENDEAKAVYLYENTIDDTNCFLEGEYGYKAFDKLAAYEDIIDDPEKLKIIDALYLERCEEINRLKEELAEKEEEFCEWEMWDDDANCFHTACENAHFFVDGNPKDNNHVYCPYCGRKIKEVQDVN